jgi:hypothetical protein
MSAYVDALRAESARINSERQKLRDEEARASAQAAREKLVPLEERVARLLATIPIEVQREGLSLSSLRILLRGRQGGNCHCGELGDALRRNGFERRRDWSGRSGGFHTRWYRSE